MKINKPTAVAVLCLLWTIPVTAQVWIQGFEQDTVGWSTDGSTIARVPSGTNGVLSKTGSFHAEVKAGAFTRWGGYSSVFPPAGYVTSLDIYLNLGAGYPNDTRFDFTSAINRPDGNHLRDFIFNAGFYDDTDSTGSGPRFVVSASNNVPGWPKNPGRSPFTISNSGWYTFLHRFYNNGSGVLAVDLSIVDSGGIVLKTWTLSDPTDIIGATVGGNRYGWFPYNYFPFLAIDNSVLATFVGPPVSKDECKKGGWTTFNVPRVFKNQGDCVSFVETGK